MEKVPPSLRYFFTVEFCYTDYGAKSDLIDLFCFFIFRKVLFFAFLEAMEDENERWQKIVQLVSVMDCDVYSFQLVNEKC